MPKGPSDGRWKRSPKPTERLDRHQPSDAWEDGDPTPVTPGRRSGKAALGQTVAGTREQNGDRESPLPRGRPRDATDRDAPQRRSTSRPGTEKGRNPGNEGSHPGGRQRGLPGRPGRDIRDGQVSRWTGRREGGQQQGSCPSGGMTPRRKEKKKNGTEKLSQWGV